MVIAIIINITDSEEATSGAIEYQIRSSLVVGRGQNLRCLVRTLTWNPLTSFTIKFHVKISFRGICTLSGTWCYPHLNVCSRDTVLQEVLRVYYNIHNRITKYKRRRVSELEAASLKY